MRYFKRVNSQGKTTTVESYSHNKPVSGTIKITKAEFDSFIASLPPPPLSTTYPEFVLPNPIMSIAERVARIESYLVELSAFLRSCGGMT